MMDARSLTILEYDKIIHELAQMAHSSLGRDRCEALLPVSDLTEVKSRQAETDDAVKQILEKGVLPLGGISDIRPSVARARSEAQLSCGELMRIGAFLRAVVRLKAQLPEDADLNRIIFRLLAQLRPARELEQRLDEAIAGEDELHDRASVQLASIRRRIRDTQNEVKESLARIVRSHARALQDQLVTLRGDRYVVPVKAEHRGEIPGIVHDTSSSGATLFIEPLAVVELNNKIRELMGLEREEIDRILFELSGLVSAQANLLLTDAELTAQLDFIMAKGRLSLKMKAMPPAINDQGRIRLRAARHPLIPKERVVPIDFELGTSFRTLVITGPNTGGKTVSLKTCGLFTLMAMAGLQIPARESSEISVFDEVLSDIGDEQSIEQDLSTFSSHLRNIVRITTAARPHTLVLVDELGSGTDPSEGAALAIAILDYLRTHGCLTVATTHYKELKGYALRTPGVENACCEFDTETLRPTYRLLIGVPGVSNAFAISRRLGLSPLIIDNARALISEEGIRFEELIQNVEKSRSEADRLRQETIALREEAAALTQQLAEEKARLADKSRQVVQKAREDARELYSDAYQEIEQLLEEIRSQQKERDLNESHQLAMQARQKIRSSLNQIEGEIGKATLTADGEVLAATDIHIGETYYAPALGLLGKIIEGPDNRGNCVLQSGTMKVNVAAEALRMPTDTEKTGQLHNRASRRQAGRRTDLIIMDRKLNMTTEIQLLGQTVEEAVSTLDKFLDDAVLAGIQNIRIVHGKGTGALRSAVHQQLKRDKRVKTFRLGAYGEGDSGVTLAELK
ncbi:MAG TPA: endonuclease MutS2 [Clostridiales bacterium]|nr:endonuclease MutS2 [Clostridiales bacterium]